MTRFITTAILCAMAAALPSIALAENESTYMTINITIGGKTMAAELIDNSSTRALVEKLQHGNITYRADDYGGFEKVGDLGFSLPQNNTQITTKPGDVILYLGKSLCLYYSTNSWNFTPMGKIIFDDQQQLRDFLHADSGEVEVTLSLPSNSGVDVRNADEVNDADCYDLAGRRTSSGAKGIAIARRGNAYGKVLKK